MWDFVSTHLNFTPDQETIIFTQMVTLVVAILGYRKSINNGSKLQEAHKELHDNTIATTAVAASVNGKLDLALATAAVVAQTNAVASKDATDALSQKIDDLKVDK